MMKLVIAIEVACLSLVHISLICGAPVVPFRRILGSLNDRSPAGDLCAGIILVDLRPFWAVYAVYARI